jgi:hypothetical protein
MIHKNLRLLSICVSCIVVLAGLTGCLFSAPKTPISIITKTLSALSLVKSYQLDTDFNDKFASIEFKGTKVIDVSQKEMGMNISITMGAYLTNDERYFMDGIDYSESVFEENSPNTIGWTKRKLDDTVWNQQTQLPMLLELLNSATRISSLETVQLNNIDCYVLTFTPSAQASVDFVLSQEQPGGPSYDTGGVGQTLVKQDTYNSGSVELWINKDNYLPVKVAVNLDFRGILPNGFGAAPTDTSNILDWEFQGELDFSNYNQPVTIQVPQDALNEQNAGN